MPRNHNHNPHHGSRSTFVRADYTDQQLAWFEEEAAEVVAGKQTHREGVLKLAEKIYGHSDASLSNRLTRTITVLRSKQ